MTPPRPPFDVGQTIDEGNWTGYQRWLVFLAALTIMFDGIDNQLLGVTIPAIMADWHVARSAFSPIVALGFVGMMSGGASGGIAGDRFGRRAPSSAAWCVFGGHAGGRVRARRLRAGRCCGSSPVSVSAGPCPTPRRSRPSASRRTRRCAVTLTIVCVPLGGRWPVCSPARPGGAPAGGRCSCSGAPCRSWRPPLTGCSRNRRATLRRGRRGGPSCRACSGGWDSPSTPTPSSVARRTRPRPRTDRTLFEAALRRDTFALWAAFFSCLLAVYLGFSWLPSILTGAGLARPSPAPASRHSIWAAWSAQSAAACFSPLRLTADDAGLTAGAVGGRLALSLMSITAHTPVWQFDRCSRSRAG